ncbi:hypothetical protein LTR36_003034 [Oleoguttula mirabilis]|uniref:Alternative oxidase n=1 Tax=Oleoguttula mirabilis TaxID=1507867 RepID=A0AAV9JWD8_9PEZI|nr:hypothetical protein LTR36_003034 [Oleoguttula mirabilis]
MYVQSLANKPPAFYAALLVVTLIPLYLGSYQYRLRYHYGGADSSKGARPVSTDFVGDWLNVHVVQPFNPSPIATYCNSTDWHPNLVFNLENANGGIGNIRGNFIDFLFFAIEAGASIILPGMASRSPTDISNVWADRAPFDMMFDEEWFLWAMGEACPQMAVYKPEKGQKMADALPGNYLPRSRRLDVGPEYSKKMYLEHLDEWLKAKAGFNPDELTLVNIERSLWEIDTRSLPLGLRRNFGQVLRINPTVRRLAALAVETLASRVYTHIDPRDAVPRRAFYGAHLRTEADARNAGWLNEPNTNFSAQTDAYIKQALKHKLKVMYVASGNATDLALFKAKAAAHAPPLIVTSKLDLLPPDALEELKQLTWDQQALVDYEVLQRCSVFGGFVKSSFSYNIAITRNQWLEDEGRVTRPWFVTHEEVGVAFDDGISRVLGRDGWHEARIPRGMWP